MPNFHISLRSKSLSEEYTINPQDELGSGQFGQVYGGVCKTTKQQVAIKVIDKTRFQDFQTETSIFQNEITILYNVQHPGIVKLHALFDEGNHVSSVFELNDLTPAMAKRKISELNF
jgi:serine/threonine protein kinase